MLRHFIAGTNKKDILTMNHSIIIITGGNSEIGLGHYQRCVTISYFLFKLYHIEAKYIIFRNSDKEFLLNNKCQIIYQINEKNGNSDALNIVDIARKEKAGLIITDSYILPCRFYSILREKLPTIPVIAIDDNGEKANYPVSGYICCNLAANPNLYPSALLKYSAIGPAFFPLRKEFINCKTSPQIGKKIVKRILITMGGSDPDNQTDRIVNIVKKFHQLETIDILVGPAYNSVDHLIKQIANDKRFILQHAPPNVALVMNKADLAISSGGITCQELLYLGIPLGVLILADNQKAVAKAIECNNWGKSLGYFSTISNVDLSLRLEDLIKTSSFFRKSINRKKIIDEKGGERIAKYVENFLKDYHSDIYKYDEISSEYRSSSQSSENYQKVKWGSQAGMFNRFQLAIKQIDWQDVNSWLDVGCGTGDLLKEVEKEHKIDSFSGVDLTDSLIELSKFYHYNTCNVSFRCQNFLEPISNEPFDLVTCIGVLHKCGISLRKAISRLAELTKRNGQLFITTKNRDWVRFNEPCYVPYPGHHWFHLKDIQTAFFQSGLKIIKMEGFEPRIQGKLGSPCEMHSIYVLAKKGLK